MCIDFHIEGSVRHLESCVNIAEYEGYPVLSIVTDGKILFLAYCLEARKDSDAQWLIARTDILTLLKMADNELTLAEALTAVSKTLTLCEGSKTPESYHFTEIDKRSKLLKEQRLQQRLDELSGLDVLYDWSLKEYIRRLYLDFFFGETIYK